MFRKKSDDELWRLQQELLDAENEEYEEEYDDEADEDLDEYLDEDDFEEDPDFGEAEEEPVYRNYANRYGKGSPKRFEEDDFFDEDDFADEDVLYRRDYKKAKRKKRRQNFGLAILAILELCAIGAVILWFLSWIQ